MSFYKKKNPYVIEKYYSKDHRPRKTNTVCLLSHVNLRFYMQMGVYLCVCVHVCVLVPHTLEQWIKMFLLIILPTLIPTQHLVVKIQRRQSYASSLQ